MAEPGRKLDNGLLKAFELHLKFERGCRERTVKIHADVMAQFGIWLRKPLINASRQDFQAYLQHLVDERRLAANTRRMHLSGIRVFYNWLAGEEEFLSPEERQDMLKLVHYLQTRIKIREPKRYPAMPFRDEIALIRDSMEQVGETKPKTMRGVSAEKWQFIFLRDRAVIELLIASGLRNQELRSLTVEDIDLERSLITVRNGKGGKQRPTLFNGRAIKALRAYFKILPKGAKPFQISAGQMGYRIKVWTQKAGIKKKLTPHSFRHYWFTNLLEQGANIQAVADMGGHESLQSTQLYTHFSVDYLKKEYEKCDI